MYWSAGTQRIPIWEADIWSSTQEMTFFMDSAGSSQRAQKPADRLWDEKHEFSP